MWMRCVVLQAAPEHGRLVERVARYMMYTGSLDMATMSHWLMIGQAMPAMYVGISTETKDRMIVPS